MSALENIEKDFGAYISNQRSCKNISQQKLSEGLGDKNWYGKIERGERIASISMQKRLMNRLGIVTEGEGEFLFYDDFAEWEARWEIISSIEDDRLDKAKRALDEYFRKYKQDKIRRQFYLVMKAQYLIHLKNTFTNIDNIKCIRVQIDDTYIQATKLTIPNIDKKELSQLILSVDELNLAFEYKNMQIMRDANLGNADSILAVYMDFIRYIEKYPYGKLAKAMLYPKIVVYMCRAMNKYLEADSIAANEKNEILKKMLEQCNKAVELLRDEAVLYYFYELLEIRKELLEAILQNNSDNELKITLETNNEWMETLSYIYNKYGVSVYTRDCCYMYKEYEVYRIGDVVRKRRKMLDMTAEELSAGICSEDTRRRLENNRVRTQSAIVKLIFNKLNLTYEYHRMGIVTSEARSVELYSEIKKVMNNNEWEIAYSILPKLKERLSEHAINKQLLERLGAVLDYETGKISIEEYIKRLKHELAYTMPIDKICLAKEKYLSIEEVSHIYAISTVLRKNKQYKEADRYAQIIRDYYKNYELNGAINKYLGMYEFVMSYVANLKGSLGFYEESNNISVNIIKEQLKAKRSNMLHSNLYNIAWNDMEMDGNKESHKNEVHKCRILSQLCKRYYYEKLYKDRE